MENIMLVDDVRTNFQSTSPSQPIVLRYCKIARYDSDYRDMGWVTNMGGLGARNINDYKMLEEFAQCPWKFKEAPGIRCAERPFEEADERPHVNLVVFDFDETLSIYTFMPEDHRSRTVIGNQMKAAEQERYIRYNFEGKAEGRIAKLQDMLKRLKDPADGLQRSLVILTKNQDGAVAVLNLLLMADLDEHFSAIWSLGTNEGIPNGVYRDSEGWKTFSLPLGNVSEEHYKAIVLKQVAESPRAWLPQMPKDDSPGWSHMKDLKLFNIVLVDDERSSFQLAAKDEDEDENKVLRYIKVAHYDDLYFDQGLLVHMGGIGAKSDKDYDRLLAFVERPWKCRMADSALEEGDLRMGFSMSVASMKGTESLSFPVDLVRRQTEDDVALGGLTGRNKRRSLTASELLPSVGRSHDELAAPPDTI
jgi:hypothetical protein